MIANHFLKFGEPKKWRIVAYLDGLQVQVNTLRELQSEMQEELDALLPSHGGATQSAEGATAGRGVQGRVVRGSQI